MGQRITVLFLGDVVGQPGNRAVFAHLKRIAKREAADCVIVNGENAAEGFGLTPETVSNLFDAGAQVVTTGNHIWQRKEIYPLLDSEPRLLRPANYPSPDPGHGVCTIDVKGIQVAVMNLQGRVRMPNTDCPFRRANELIRAVKRDAQLIIVDFHAEETAEKEALALSLDGQITAQVGTHTHVTTNDARVLPGGTAFITDVGACGPKDAVIGFDPAISVRRALTQLPLRNEVSENPAVINGVVIEADADTGRALSIRSIREEATV